MRSKTIIFLSVFFFCNCSSKFEKVDDDKFIGLWEVKGREMFDGIHIKIAREEGALVGRIAKLNSNKLVTFFADTTDIWVSEIERSSNYQFKLTEKKIAKDLFSLYGISTSQQFKVQFIDDNTIGLAAESSDPLKSTITYKKIGATVQ